MRVPKALAVVPLELVARLDVAQSIHEDSRLATHRKKKLRRPTFGRASLWFMNLLGEPSRSSRPSMKVMVPSGARNAAQ